MPNEPRTLFSLQRQFKMKGQNPETRSSSLKNESNRASGQKGDCQAFVAISGGVQ
jgi:hypothetical protein